MAEKSIEDEIVAELEVYEILTDIEQFHEETKEIIVKATESRKVLSYASDKVRIFSFLAQGNNYFEVYEKIEREWQLTKPAFMCYFQEQKLINSFLMGLIEKWEKSSGNSDNIGRNH